ncbi:hypothetical protein TGPRC2_200595A, partial [Toxoplasma gondii TgCatPRC2]
MDVQCFMPAATACDKEAAR